MKKLITILLLLTLSSCTRLSMTWISDYNEISKKTYIKNVYDCSDKAFDLGNLHEGEVLFVYIKKSQSIHAIVWIDPYLVDPTWQRIVYCPNHNHVYDTVRINWGIIKEWYGINVL